MDQTKRGVNQGQERKPVSAKTRFYKPVSQIKSFGVNLIVLLDFDWICSSELPYVHARVGYRPNISQHVR